MARTTDPVLAVPKAPGDFWDRCTIIAIGCLFYFLALLDFRYETKYQRSILKLEILWVLAVD